MLGFADGNLSGSTGCNTFGGRYEQSGSALAITLGPTTLIGCPPPLDEQERAVLAALPKTESFTVDGGSLTLLDADGKQLLSYDHAEPVSLTGPAWQVTGIRQDSWARQHRILVEEEKPASEKGTYLNPEAAGAGAN